MTVIKLDSFIKSMHLPSFSYFCKETFVSYSSFIKIQLDYFLVNFDYLNYYNNFRTDEESRNKIQEFIYVL